jgi:hypothetical protein
MLEHEDHDMMRPFVVTDDDDGGETCELPVEDGTVEDGGPVYESNPPSSGSDGSDT